MKLIEMLRERRSARRANRAQRLDEQAKLRREREARGVPGAELHGPPDNFSGYGGV